MFEVTITSKVQIVQAQRSDLVKFKDVRVYPQDERIISNSSRPRQDQPLFIIRYH